MNIDATILNKKWQAELYNTSKGSFTTTKLALSQECRDGSIYANQ
jgi:hypothetical protein